jgi:poly-gamma-glutamate capsule biosynthesis protein CapA/YwtB (metallophosphatase superfamily)
VSLHWGNEYEDIPLQSQRDRARRIIDAGADAIIGHHPHIPQGIEIYKQRPILYSLGNLLNGFYEPGQVDNIMAVLHCYGPNVIGLELIPIAGRNVEMHMQPYVLEGEQLSGAGSYPQAVVTLRHRHDAGRRPHAGAGSA